MLAATARPEHQPTGPLPSVAPALLLQLEMVAPFTPNFPVAGSEDLVSRLRDATPGTRVRIEELVERASRTYQLRRVETGDTPLPG